MKNKTNKPVLFWHIPGQLAYYCLPDTQTWKPLCGLLNATEYSNARSSAGYIRLKANPIRQHNPTDH